MIDQILDRLEDLKIQLAAIDPACESEAADKVAAIAAALRGVLAGQGRAVGEGGPRAAVPAVASAA